MLFKTLKHKTAPDTYGVATIFENGKWELGMTSIPTLQPMAATIEGLTEYWKAQNNSEFLVEQLKDYELVTVQVIPAIESKFEIKCTNPQ